MDRTERIPDFEEMLRVVQNSLAERLWTGGPGIIETVNLTAMTCTVQPAIMAYVKQQTGEYLPVQLPLLLDVPLKFPQGGGLALTFPVAPMDECYVSIADRCIDNWWAKSGVQLPAELRMHDLSDGFAFVGINSQPNVFTVSPNSARIGKKDGSAFVEITQSGVVNIMAATINLTGAVNVTGNVATTGTLKNNSVNVGSTHVHSGVQTGASLTGDPQ